MTAPAVGDDMTANWAGLRPRSCAGAVSINVTTANTPTSAAITWPTGRFAGGPQIIVQATAVSSAPGTTVKGVSVLSVSPTGANIWVTLGSAATITIFWTATAVE